MDNIKEKEKGELLWDWQKAITIEPEATGEHEGSHGQLPDCTTEAYLQNILAQTATTGLVAIYCQCGHHIIAISVKPSKFWPTNWSEDIVVYKRNPLT